MHRLSQSAVRGCSGSNPPTGLNVAVGFSRLVVELVSRARDWMRQAVKAHAEASLRQGDYEWACFAAQQAAEKAVKALYESRNMKAWGRSVSRLLEHLPENLKPAPSLLDKAKELDRHYIPTRYPNLHSEGAPLLY